MKTFKYLIIAGALTLSSGMQSCADFLNEDPKGQLVPEGFYKTANDLEMAVHALYYNVARSQVNSNQSIIQAQGDDITSTTGSNKAAYLSADCWAEPSDYKGVNDLWARQYYVIQAANVLIANADKCQTSQENINIALGNAYFWRASAYFQLVRAYGPLPLNLTNAADNNSTPLTPVAGVYDQILADLKAAEACQLPVSYKGRDGFGSLGYLGECNLWISEQAVKSMLAAVYMNMAGYPLNKTEYYAEAANKAKEVVDGVNSGKYPQALNAQWKDVYSYGNNYSAEGIVTISYYAEPGKMGSFSEVTSQFPLCHRFSQFNGGWSDFVPERYYWSQFPEGPRKDAVYDPVLNIYIKDQDDKDICVSWWATKDEKPYSATAKNALVSLYHPMFSSLSVNADADGNPIAAPYDCRGRQVTLQSLDVAHRYIRYSEVLCWFAEASARAGLYAAEARAALEQVQARAYAPGVKPDNSDLAEAAYREHGYEVAGYPLALVTRRADMFRMNRMEQAWRYRTGPQTDVLVPKGTLTYSYKETKITDPVTKRPKYVKTPYTYVLSYDVVLPEEMSVASQTPTWQGENSIYNVYPPAETEKNPNIHR